MWKENNKTRMPLGVTSTLYYLSNTVLGCFAQFFLGLSSLATLLSLCFSVTFSFVI